MMSAETNAMAGGYGQGHAVVIGGSMAGLLAARVLSDRFERVTVVERDRYPEGFENRKGVPQARHAHALLPRGFMIMARLFPGLGRGTGLGRRHRLRYSRGEPAVPASAATGCASPSAGRAC